MQSECKEIESLILKHDPFNLHEKIKAIAVMKNSGNINFILDKNNNSLIEATCKRLETFEMWCFDGSRVSYIDYVTNVTKIPIDFTRQDKRLENIRQWTRMTTIQLFRIAVNKVLRTKVTSTSTQDKHQYKKFIMFLRYPVKKNYIG